MATIRVQSQMKNPNAKVISQMKAEKLHRFEPLLLKTDALQCIMVCAL